MKENDRRFTPKKILLLAALLLLLTGAGLFFVPVRTVTFEGNSYYQEDELRELIIKGRRALPFFAAEKLKSHPVIPFIEKYTVSFDSWRDVRIQVYEKSLAGYLSFQNYCLYFDWDGVMVESSSRKLAGIPEVTGLKPAHVVLGEKIPAEYDSCFRTILIINQFLNSTQINWEGRDIRLSEIADKLSFSDEDATVVFGKINVLLGGSEHMEEKLFLMADMLPELYGREGTLYLDTYVEGQAHPSYVFK